MSKWKCNICGKEFDNFHAQGFDNKVYCPLCFFKEENRRLKIEKQQLEIQVDRVHSVLSMVREKHDLYKEVIEEVREYIKENTQWFDKKLGLVEMEGYNTNRIPVIYLYGLLQILDKAKEKENESR